MRDQLRLTFEADTDGTGELFASVNAHGYSGIGSAWFDTQTLVKFSSQLAHAYPLPTAPLLALEGGVFNDDRQSLLQLRLGLKFYPVGSLGVVACHVSLASYTNPCERQERTCRVSVELLTQYEALHSFARAMRMVVLGGTDEAVLATNG